MQISFENVTYRYLTNNVNEREAINQLTLTIPSSSFTALMGANGSGKTTALQMIAGVYAPDSGTLRIGNHIYTGKRQMNPVIHKDIGYVFQYPESQLFEPTVAKDIGFGPSSLNLPAKEIEERVDHAMTGIGLSLSLKERSPFRLSGGQRRRVAIAGVLAMRPQVLILDEPTVGLDHQGQKHLLDTLYRYQQKQKVTIVIVSHQMDEVITYANHLIIMQSGKCIWQGEPLHILSEPEILQAAQLKLPEITQMIVQLNRQLNIDIPLGTLTVEQLERYLLEHKQKHS